MLLAWVTGYFRGFQLWETSRETSSVQDPLRMATVETLEAQISVTTTCAMCTFGVS